MTSLALFEQLPANKHFTCQMNDKAVDVSEDHIINDFINRWRVEAAADFLNRVNDQSCVIDGTPVGPVPSEGSVVYELRSKTPIFIHFWHNEHGKTGSKRWQIINVVVEVPYDATPTDRSTWNKADKGVQATTRGVLTNAIRDRIHSPPPIPS